MCVLMRYIYRFLELQVNTVKLHYSLYLRVIEYYRVNIYFKYMLIVIVFYNFL